MHYYRIMGIRSQKQREHLEEALTPYLPKGAELAADYLAVADGVELDPVIGILAFEQLTLKPLSTSEVKELYHWHSEEEAIHASGGYAEDHAHQSEHQMGIVFILNVAFTILEVITGFWFGSTAVLSDAVHDSGDVLAIAIAWLLEKFSSRPADDRYSYGYQRFSLLGALITSVFLLISSLLIIATAIPKFFHPEAVNTAGVFWLAIFALVVNGGAAYVLHHGHSANQRLLSIHLLEDVLGWVAILIMSVILRFTAWTFIDPLLSMAIAGWIIYETLPEFKKIAALFLQGTPKEVDLPCIRRDILNIPGVAGVSHLHVWSTDGSYHMGTVSVVTTADTVHEQTLIKQRIRERAAECQLIHLTIDVVYLPADYLYRHNH
ncbi:MAG: cation diffusion facilitator family transporter [Aerococcus sp.]|nr:cation diffusion facilitator family transporter [Aerococcus sp.]